MGWSEAYNFNLGQSINITEAMFLRKGNDPRAGDLHCHEECYETKSGSRLVSVKESIDEETGRRRKRAFFRRWPTKSQKTGFFCSFERIATSKRESMDYSMYYHQFDDFLNSIDLNKKPFFIESVSKDNGEYEPDFELIHSKKILERISKSSIYIIDENMRRTRKTPESRVIDDEFIIVIRISEYTIEQLTNFQRGGIERFELEWKYLVNFLEVEIKNERVNQLKKIEEYEITKENDVELLKQVDKAKNEIEHQDKEIIEVFSKIKSRTSPIITDTYNDICKKLEILHRYLSGRLIEIQDLPDFNNPKWIDWEISLKLYTDKTKKYSHDSESLREILGKDYAVWWWSHDLTIGKVVSISNQASTFFIKLNNEKKRLWAEKYPSEYQQINQKIKSLGMRILEIEKGGSLDNKKYGIFENSNDSKVDEMMQILGTNDNEREIKKLRNERFNLRKQIHPD